MLKSFFTIAWRYFKKDRQFTILNLIGLGTGLASTLLIWLWVNSELNVDKYNEKDDHLYQVLTNSKSNDGIETGEYTAGLLAPAIKAEIPEIEFAASVLPASWFSNKGIFTYEKKSLKADGDYVSKDFFDVMTVRFLRGDKQRLFTDNLSAAISEDMAMKVYGTTDVIGKTFDWKNSEFGGRFLITGVFEKTPEGSTLRPDVLFNFALVLELRPNLLKFSNSDPHTYVILKPGTDLQQVNKKINDVLKTKDKETSHQLFLAKYSDRYLHGTYQNGVQSGGRITYVKLFSFIAVFILIIACINFMNLSTAKASRRMKEVGIRKVVGAGRGSLVIQYLSESLLMTFISLILAIGLVWLTLPVFNGITGKSLHISLGWKEISGIIAITIFTGIAAGSYPALYLSGFNPLTVLKGKFNTSIFQIMVRKGLVVFQFCISIIFIAAVLIVYRQLNFIQSKNLGYDRENVIHFEIPLEFDSTKMAAAAGFVQRLQNIPGVVSAASFAHNLTGDHGGISGFEWPGKDPGMDIDFANLEMGAHFLETAGIKIIDGRNFSEGINARNEIVFNETAIRMMGLKNPVGKTIRFWGMDKVIVGVAADFNFESLYEPLKPCFFQIYPVAPNIMVRLQKGAEHTAIPQIQKAFTAFAPDMDFDYRFLDEDYKALYISEQRVSILARYFSVLAILICCLGLFGLTAFTAARRQKEIGIRKVVGATVSQVSILLSREFFGPVLLSICIAFPFVIWIMSAWLNNFAYRISISADIFLLTALFAMAITVLTISYNAVKAAMANPAKVLRTE